MTPHITTEYDDRLPAEAAEAGEHARERSADEPEVEVERHEVERISVEGMPAHPTFRVGALALTLAGITAAVAVLAIVVGALTSPTVGWAVFIVSLVLGVLANPMVWAAVLRVKEREVVHQRVRQSRRSSDESDGGRAS